MNSETIYHQRYLIYRYLSNVNIDETFSPYQRSWSVRNFSSTRHLSCKLLFERKETRDSYRFSSIKLMQIIATQLSPLDRALLRVTPRDEVGRETARVKATSATAIGNFRFLRRRDQLTTTTARDRAANANAITYPQPLRLCEGGSGVTA